MTGDGDVLEGAGAGLPLPDPPLPDPPAPEPVLLPDPGLPLPVLPVPPDDAVPVRVLPPGLVPAAARTVPAPVPEDGTVPDGAAVGETDGDGVPPDRVTRGGVVPDPGVSCPGGVAGARTDGAEGFPEATPGTMPAPPVRVTPRVAPMPTATATADGTAFMASGCMRDPFSGDSAST